VLVRHKAFEFCGFMGVGNREGGLIPWETARKRACTQEYFNILFNCLLVLEPPVVTSRHA
jgi:hypothetical protein